MGKKKQQGHALPHPEYEKLMTVEEVDELIQQHKDTLVRKDKTEFQIKEAKQEMLCSYNEQLAELKEEREHELGVIDALHDRKKILLSGQGVIPMPVRKS